MEDQNITGGAPSRAEDKTAIRVRHGDVVMTFGDTDSFFYTVKDPVGLHARPAGAIVKLAKQFKSEITLSVGEKSARAGSVFELMSLGALPGSRLKVTARGEDEREALEAFHSFLREKL